MKALSPTLPFGDLVKHHSAEQSSNEPTDAVLWQVVLVDTAAYSPALVMTCLSLLCTLDACEGGVRGIV